MREARSPDPALMSWVAHMVGSLGSSAARDLCSGTLPAVDTSRGNPPSAELGGPVSVTLSRQLFWRPSLLSSGGRGGNYTWVFKAKRPKSRD